MWWQQPSSACFPDEKWGWIDQVHHSLCLSGGGLPANLNCLLVSMSSIHLQSMVLKPRVVSLISFMGENVLN